MPDALIGIYKVAIPLAIGTSLLRTSMYDVKGGTRVVIFDRYSRVKDKVIGEGTHFLIPWLQKSIIYDVRTKPRNISTNTGSKDLQMIGITLRVLHRPEILHLPTIYRNLGQDYDELVLPSIVNEVLKSTIGQFDAEELITQREAVSDRIRSELQRRAQNFSIVLEDVSITHITFGKEFIKVVEQKQIAQQDAERARFIGEAESAALISKAMAQAGDSLIMVRRIESYRQIAQTLAQNPNVTYLPGGRSDGKETGSKFLLGLGK
ncbi:band 7 family-domain-containing protein [Xylogone sp. PMI_703]|nr:band 7 family-domain-containing protein [Xylogone sp. PMI_703]